MNMKNIFGVVAVLLVVLLLAGCQGQTSAQADMKADGQQENAADAQADVAVDAKVDTEVKVEPKVEVKADVKADVAVATNGKSLKDLLSGKGTKYTATYTMTSAQGNAEFTLSQDLPHLAYDMKLAQGESKTILDGETIYSCNNMAGSWACYKMTTTQPLASEQLEKDVADNKVAPEYKGVCTVAGESGSEYEVVNQDSDATVCYTADGILLKMETMKPIATSLTATSVKRSVDASAFVVPADAQAMPSYPGMPQQ